MKATVDRRAFTAALRRALPAVAKNSSWAVLSGARLELADGQLSIQCADLDVQMTTAVGVEADVDHADGVVIVPAARLSKLVAGMAGDTLELDDAVDDSGLVVTAGRTVGTLNTLPVDDWPRFDHANDGPLVTFDQAHLQALKAVLSAVADDPGKPVLGGIRFHGGMADATDGYRAVRARLDGIIAPDIVVPADAIRHIVDQPGVVAMRATDNAALLCGEGGADWFELRTQLLQGAFPDVDKVIRSKSDHHLSVDRAVLAGALARVQAVSDDARRITLEVDGPVLTITSLEAGVGQVIDQVDVDGTLAEGLQLHAQRTMDLIGHVVGDTVTLDTVDALKYVQVEDGPVTLVLVPLKPAR